MSSNAALRATNSEQRAEIERLTALLRQIERSLEVVGSTPIATRRRTAAPTAAPSKRRKQGTRRKPKPITDPLLLEKRRAALERAREVLAAKRAAAKAT